MYSYGVSAESADSERNLSIRTRVESSFTVTFTPSRRTVLREIPRVIHEGISWSSGFRRGARQNVVDDENRPKASSGQAVVEFWFQIVGDVSSPTLYLWFMLLASAIKLNYFYLSLVTCDHVDCVQPTGKRSEACLVPISMGVRCVLRAENACLQMIYNIFKNRPSESSR